MIRTFRSRESGMSAIPFVVSLFLVVGFAIAWYNADQAANELKGSVARANDAKKDAEAERLKLDNRLLDLTEVTGYGDASAKPDKAAIQAALDGALQKWRETLTIEFTADKYTPTGNGGIIEKLAGDKVRVKYIADKDQISNPSIQTLLPLIEAATARMQNDIKRAFEATAAEVRSKVEQKTSYDAAIAAAKAQYDQVVQEKAQSERTAAETIRELRDQVQNKDQALQQAQAEAETVKAESAKQVAELSSKLSEKTAEFQTVKSKEQPFISEGPDGEVVGAGAGLVIVNRGKKDMLMPGTTFTVLGRVKGGDLVEKGEIRVVVSHDGTADCRVISQNPGNPITRGDLIQSLVYSPNRVLHFCLVGEFKKMGRAQAEARLKALGAVVDTDVTVDTNYIVTGSPAAGETLDENENVRKAKVYGITPLTETQLASFTMY